jgi:hypothetical protein
MGVPHDGRAIAPPVAGGGGARAGAGWAPGGVRAPERWVRVSAQVRGRATQQRLPVAILVAAALTVACSASEREPGADTTATTVRVAVPPPESLPAGDVSRTDSARFRYWSFAGRLSGSRADVAAKLGAPRSTTGAALRNRHDPHVVDSLVTLWYAGISVQFFVGARGKEFPIAVSVTDSGISLPLPVGIGARRTEIDRTFGLTDYEKWHGDTLLAEYLVPSAGISPGDDELVFAFVRGIVRRIGWVYYVD